MGASGGRDEAERSVLRWSGLAGIAGSILFVAVFVFVGVVIGADPAGPAGAIARFPEIRALRTIENGLYLLVLVLWVAHALGLYRVLRDTGAAALYGTGLTVMGLAVLAAGALPHAASVPLANLYHAPGATAQEQVALVAAWHATQGVINTLLVTGLVILPVALVGLGVAMRATPALGRRSGTVSIALGAVGAGAAVLLLMDPLSPIAVVGILVLILFHLVVGWRLYRRATAEPGSARADRAFEARPSTEPAR
jgi:hypothetical protein